MVAVVSVIDHISQRPIPNALPDSLTPRDYERLYKILFAYFWMMLFIQDPRAKRVMRRLLTRITDQNEADTDRICDAFEEAFKPGDSEGPQFTLGKTAWSIIQRAIPTNNTVEGLVHMTLPIKFDQFRGSVTDLFS